MIAQETKNQLNKLISKDYPKGKVSFKALDKFLFEQGYLDKINCILKRHRRG